MNALHCFHAEATPHILRHLHPGIEGWTANHRDYALHSAFQPIVSLSHCRTVGHEALIRANLAGGKRATPSDLFAEVDSEAELVWLDRLCRALHVHNFIRAGNDDCWLFLNVHPTVSVRGRHYGEFFEALLAAVGLPPERVVIEILEDAIPDDHQLADAVSFYRNRGCLVAVDDFGIGHSNFGRIWQVKPHIVKLDRSTLISARQDAAARRVLPGLVNLLHEAGCLVLIEGIENEFEALLAMESGADLAQGYFFAMPAPSPQALDASSPPLQRLIEDYRAQLQQRDRREHDPDLTLTLQSAVDELAGHDRLEGPSVARLLEMSRVERCYLIDQEGRQIGDSRTASGKTHIVDKRFHPLDHADNALWIRRAYWRNALMRPGEVQTTQPYLSVATGKLCITHSLAFPAGSAMRVLCLDLEHDDSNA